LLVGVLDQLRSFVAKIAPQDDNVLLLDRESANVEKAYFVYMMSNSSKMLYTGVTNNVEARAFQHKSKRVPGFTRDYNLHKLVYFEEFGSVRGAIRREKQIKGWLRAKEVALIESVNPRWDDLSKDHAESAARFMQADTRSLSS
jgi:putative endonuclease